MGTGPTPDGFVPLSDDQIDVGIQRLATIYDTCGPDGTVYLGGSSTVSPLAEVWGEHYSEQCPGIDVVVAAGGSSEGARLACGIGSDLTADPDIGMMSRGFKDAEASTAADGYTYTCIFGEAGSTGKSVDVSNDGVTVFAEVGGPAGNCLAALAPGGLSFDQLKAMFNEGAAPKWSDFNSACDAVPVEIAIPDPTGGTFDFFKSVLFADGGAFRSGDGVYVGPEGTDDPVLDLVAEHPAAATFIGFPDYNTASNKVGVAIEGVFPDPGTISSGDYSILGRKIHMRVRSSHAAAAVPYIKDGLHGPTPQGYVPLNDDQVAEMIKRLETLSSPNSEVA